MRRSPLRAIALGAGLAVVVAAPAAGASRTLTLEGWSPRALAFSGGHLVWTETAVARVDPARIPGSPPGAQRFDYYRSETSRVRLDRRSRLFAGPRETPVAVRTSIAGMTPGVLWPTGGGNLLVAPESRRFAPPVILCCDDEGTETVVASDGRADAPVTVAAFAAGTSVRTLDIDAAGRQTLRDVDGGGAVTATPLAATTAIGLAALTPATRAWVDPARPSELLVHPAGAAAATPIALPGRAVRLWGARGLVAISVRRGPASWVVLRVDDGPAPRAVRVWSGRRAPRVAVGGGSVAVADGRRVLAARRGAVRPVVTARRRVDAVGVDGRRVAWVERGLRRGARVGVVRLGRVA